MEVSDARNLKLLGDENRRLKKLLAESMLDASTLREMLGKTSSAQLLEACCDLGGPREGLVCGRARSRCVHDPLKSARRFGLRSAAGERIKRE
jgi:hypothetical protein